MMGGRILDAPYWLPLHDPVREPELRRRAAMNSILGVRSNRGKANAAIRNCDLRALPRKAQDTIMRVGASECRQLSRLMNTKKTKTKKTKTTKKTTRCIAALEWLAHSPPQVRELILAYTNNALSRQYRPPSADVTFFGTIFHFLDWNFVSKAFLKKVFSGLDDDNANDACFTCGCRKRELRWMYLGVLQLQLHRSGVLTLSNASIASLPQGTGTRVWQHTCRHCSKILMGRARNLAELWEWARAWPWP